MKVTRIDYELSIFQKLISVNQFTPEKSKERETEKERKTMRYVEFHAFEVEPWCVCVSAIMP